MPALSGLNIGQAPQQQMAPQHPDPQQQYYANQPPPHAHIQPPSIQALDTIQSWDSAGHASPRRGSGMPQQVRAASHNTWQPGQAIRFGPPGQQQYGQQGHDMSGGQAGGYHQQGQNGQGQQQQQPKTWEPGAGIRFS
jgi:hypothetical protein